MYFIIQLCTKFHMCSSDSTLIIVIKYKTKFIADAAAVLF
jgi:hypothetical protein